MATTARQMIRASLRILNVLAENETIDSEQLETDALQNLNFMLGEWSNDGLIIYQTEQQTFSCVASTASYAIGPGATWNGNRPLKINEIYVTSGSSDYPVDEITEKEYMGICSKSSEGLPRYFFYNTTNPNGKVSLYPVPDQAYSITLSNDVEFTEYSITDNITLPTGYLNAIKYNLALECQPEFQEDAEINQWIVNRAQKTLSKLKRINKKIAPKKKYDTAITTRYGYNIYSGSYQ